ncbi:MAG: hypothetical protein PHE84_12870 [bacterium]|nr:hypothetical protein [bacterium]
MDPQDRWEKEMKINRKKTKNKKRSCALCKPWKKGWMDRRTVSWIREDVKTVQEIREMAR